MVHYPWHGTLLCISGEQKSEKDDTYKIFNEFKGVINIVNESVGTAQQPVREIIKETEDDEKSQWFIVSLMRLVQENNWQTIAT